MKPEEIYVGQTLTYYPAKEVETDNRHFPATIEAVGSRIKCRVFMEGFPQGVVRFVAAKLLTDQPPLIDEGD